MFVAARPPVRRVDCSSTRVRSFDQLLYALSSRTRRYNTTSIYKLTSWCWHANANTIEAASTTTGSSEAFTISRSCMSQRLGGGTWPDGMCNCIGLPLMVISVDFSSGAPGQSFKQAKSAVAQCGQQCSLIVIWTPIQ